MDITFSRVFVPYFVDAVRSMKPSRLLEIGCGTGHLVSAVAATCAAQCYAIEPSDGMFGAARDVLRGKGVNVCQARIEEYVVEELFDVVISHLCIQAVSDAREFLEASALRLCSDGLLLLSLPHPCFWNDYKQFVPSSQYCYMDDASVIAPLTITLDENRPISVPYFHRPLSRYIEYLGAAGLVLTKFDEIWPSEEIQAMYGRAWDTPRYTVIWAAKGR